MNKIICDVCGGKTTKNEYELDCFYHDNTMSKGEVEFELKLNVHMICKSFRDEVMIYIHDDTPFEYGNCIDEFSVADLKNDNTLLDKYMDGEFVSFDIASDTGNIIYGVKR